MGQQQQHQNLRNSQQLGFDAQQNQQQRAIMGGKLPLGGQMGEDSFPGPDVTYTPPLQIQNPMVNLGCLSSAQITDIVPVNVTWPSTQVPSSFVTGSQGPVYSVGGDSQNPRAVGTSNIAGEGGGGQPYTDTANAEVTVQGGVFQDFEVPNANVSGYSTPFQAAVYLTSDVQLYNISATAAGYGNITLSQEGVLWTLKIRVLKLKRTHTRHSRHY